MSIKDYEDLTPKLVDRAKAGDRNAALRVLEVFVAAVEKGQQPHPSVMTYLSKAFQDILDEVDVTSALHLLKPPHRPADPKIEIRNEAIALSVDRLRKRGINRDDAIEKNAERFGVSYEVSEAAYKKYTNPELKHFAELLNYIETGS